MCSLIASPLPTPHASRPSASTAVVATAWARIARWIRNIGHMTPTARSMLFLAWAIAPSKLHTNGAWPCRAETIPGNTFRRRVHTANGCALTALTPVEAFRIAIRSLRSRRSTADAVDTGYRHHGQALWLSASETVAYLVTEDSIEAWPSPLTADPIRRRRPASLGL